MLVLENLTAVQMEDAKIKAKYYGHSLKASAGRMLYALLWPRYHTAMLSALFMKQWPNAKRYERWRYFLATNTVLRSWSFFRGALISFVPGLTYIIRRRKHGFRRACIDAKRLLEMATKDLPQQSIV